MPVALSAELDDAPTRIHSHVGAASPPPLADMARELIGAELDHFELLDCIGAGGMGRVFRARDTRLDRLVALKVLSPELGDDPELLRRFEQEAKAAGRLDNPHFARVFYYGFAKGLRFIAMEFVEGENLRRRIAVEGRLTAGDLLLLALQIALGLAHASARGVVHRDIKPSNIILTPEGAAKLVDMGLARDFLQANGEITQTNVTMGTLDYISPEQASDPRRVDVRSDIYSLGCTLYHAATGEPPFPDGTGMQKLLQHQNVPAPDARILAPELPAEVAVLLTRMMAKRAEDRQQTAAELIYELREMTTALNVPIPFATPALLPPQASAWRLRNASWMISTALLLIGVFSYTLINRPEDLDLPPERPALGAAASPSADANSTLRRPAVEPVFERPGEGRVVVVPEGADLQTVVRSVPEGATLRLAGDEYALTPSHEEPAGVGLTIEKSVTLEPLRRLARTKLFFPAATLTGAADAKPVTLVAIRAGRVNLNRLWLESPRSRPSTTLHLEQAQAALNDCLFEGASDALRQAAKGTVSVHAAGGAFTAVDCRFVGGETCFRSSGAGSTAFQLWDCALGVYRRPFRLEGSRTEGRIDHCTVVVGPEPIFTILKPTYAKLEVENSVFGYPGSEKCPALIELNAELGVGEALWRGRGNLFAGGLTPQIITLRLVRVDEPSKLRTYGFVDDGRIVPAWPLLKTWADVVMTGVEVRSPWRPEFALNAAVHKPGADGLAAGVVQTRDDEEGAAETNDPQPAAKAVSAAPNVEGQTPAKQVVVDDAVPAGAQPGVYKSLQSVLNDAALGRNVIVTLRCVDWNERGLRLEKNRDLVVRGAAGKVYKNRPAAPRDGEDNDAPIFELAAGAKLTLEGVNLDVRTGEATEPAPVFRCAPGSTVVLRQCIVKIGEAGKAGSAVVFEIVGVPPTNTMMHSEPPTIDLTGTGLHVAGSLLSAEPAYNWTLNIADCRIGAEGSLLHIAGKSERRSEREQNLLTMSQSTLLLGKSLLAIDPQIMMEMPSPVQVKADGCALLHVGADADPLAAVNVTELNGAMTGFDNLVKWQGKWNFIAGFPVLLRIPKIDAGMGLDQSRQRELNFADWADLSGLTKTEYFHSPKKQTLVASIWENPPGAALLAAKFPELNAKTSLQSIGVLP